METMTTNNDIAKALTQLHEDRDMHLLRSVVALFGLDITNLDNLKTIGTLVSELKENDEEIQAHFVAETNNFIRDEKIGQNVNSEIYLNRACEHLTSVRLGYLSSEWELIKEKLDDIDETYIWGRNVFGLEERWDDDHKTCWITIFDGHDTFAMVSLGLDKTNHGNDDYFAVRSFTAVEEGKGFTSLIDDEVTVTTSSEEFFSMSDSGVLCDAVVRTVKQFMDRHDEKLRFDRDKARNDRKN